MRRITGMSLLIAHESLATLIKNAFLFLAMRHISKKESMDDKHGGLHDAPQDVEHADLVRFSHMGFIRLVCWTRLTQERTKRQRSVNRVPK